MEREMKTIIAGSRTLGFMAVVKALTQCPFTDQITEVVSGCANGVDLAGEEWAKFVGLPIAPFPVSPADWDKFGKSAGHRRNLAMGHYASALVAVWDGRSTGTADMIRIATTLHCYPDVFVWTPTKFK